MAPSSLVTRLWLPLFVLATCASISSTLRAEEYPAHYARYREAIEARDLETAVVHARRALLAATRERGPSDPRTGVLAYNLGVVNFELGRYRDASIALRTALPIYEKTYGIDSEKYARPLVKLAASHHQLEEWREAERLYVQAEGILTRLRGRNDEEVGLILGQLTQVASGLDDPKRTRAYGLRSLAILGRLDDEDPVAIANLHIAVAGAEMKLGDPRQARRHTERAVELYESRLDKDDPQLLGVYRFASNVYEQTGRQSTARKYRRLIDKATSEDD